MNLGNSRYRYCGEVAMNKSVEVTAVLGPFYVEQLRVEAMLRLDHIIRTEDLGWKASKDYGADMGRICA